MIKAAAKVGWWCLAMVGPIGYVLPMAIPLLAGNYWIDPWVQDQGWSGWARMIFWLFYTGISTGLTFSITVTIVQWLEPRATPRSHLEMRK